MAARPLLDPYKAPTQPRTGPPVPNMNGFAPPAASQPRSFVAAAPMAAGAKPGPVPTMGGVVPPKMVQNIMQGFGTTPPPVTQATPPPTAPNVPAPPLGQDPTHGHFPIPQAGLPQASAGAAIAAATPKPATTPAPATQKTGGGGGGPVVPVQEQKTSNQILNWLNMLISGKGGAYGPAAMGSMKSDLLRATQGQLASSTDAINSDAVARGLYRSGVAGRNVATAARGAASDYSSGVRDLLEKKAASDSQMRVQALGMKQQWLDSLRNAGFQRQQMAMAGRGGGPDTINYIDPTTGQTQQMDPRMLELMLKYGGSF